MIQPPVLIPSTLASRWGRLLAGRTRGTVAAVATVLGAGALSVWFMDDVPAASEAAPSVKSAMATKPIAARGVVTSPVSERARPAIDMAPVLTEGGLRVLLRAEVDEGWLAAEPASVAVDDGVTVVTRSLDDAGRAEFAGVVGERVRLHRADGRVACVARVIRAVALGRFDDSGSPAPKERPEIVWERATGTHVIAGDLEPIEGRCESVEWARSESAPPPAMASRRATAPEIRRDAIAAFQARPEYRELTDGSGNEKYEVTTLATEDETIVVTVLMVEGCVEQWPALTGFWRPGPDGKLMFLGAEESLTEIVVAADADGDGRMEILAQDDIAGVSILRLRRSGRYHVATKAPLAIHGCRC